MAQTYPFNVNVVADGNRLFGSCWSRTKAPENYRNSIWEGVRVRSNYATLVRVGASEVDEGKSDCRA